MRVICMKTISHSKSKRHFEAGNPYDVDPKVVGDIIGPRKALQDANSPEAQAQQLDGLLAQKETLDEIIKQKFRGGVQDAALLKRAEKLGMQIDDLKKKPGRKKTEENPPKEVEAINEVPEDGEQ